MFHVSIVQHNTRAMAVVFGTLLLFSLQASNVSALQEESNAVHLKTEKIIVFKDGYTLVVKRGTATTDDNGKLFTNQVPDEAILGSVWSVSTKGSLLTMNSGWETAESETEKEVPCTKVFEILEANVGKECDIELKDEMVQSGTILRVLTQPTEVGVPGNLLEELGLASTEQVDAGDSESSVSHLMSSTHGTHFMLRHDKGDVLLAVEDVKSLSIRDMKSTIKRTIKTTTREKRLTFGFEEANQECDVLLMYFRPGVRWIPTYRVELATDGSEMPKAKMSLQAELLDEAEDFIDADVDIVVGVPNFRFGSIPSPLTLERTLRNSLAQAAPQLSNGFGNNSIVSNQLMSQRPSQLGSSNSFEGVGDSGVELPSELTSTASQELYIYNLNNLTLKKGDRTAVMVLTADIAYRNVYTWDVHLQRDDLANTVYDTSGQSPLRLSQNKVWRQIELANRTQMPWTTGAAMIMEGQQPLAQELLTYTPAGDQCRIPVTVAVDIRGGVTEEEIDRKLNALTWGDHRYSKVSQRASLRLVNRKDEAVEVEVAIQLGGRVDEASDEGNIDVRSYRAEDWTRYRGDPSVNNSSTVRWLVKLGPGESFEPTVDYHYFARQ